MPFKKRVKTPNTFDEFKSVLNTKFPQLSNLRRNSIAGLAVEVRKGSRNANSIRNNIKEITYNQFLDILSTPINSTPSPTPSPSPSPSPAPAENPEAQSNLEYNHGSSNPEAEPLMFQSPEPPVQEEQHINVGGRNSIPLQSALPPPPELFATRVNSPHEAFLKKFGKTAKAKPKKPWLSTRRKSRRNKNKKTRRTRR